MGYTNSTFYLSFYVECSVYAEKFNSKKKTMRSHAEQQFCEQLMKFRTLKLKLLLNILLTTIF